MESSDPGSFPGSMEQVLSSVAFERLQITLEQMAQELSAYHFTDCCPGSENDFSKTNSRLTLVISPAFSALLWGQPQTAETYQTRLYLEAASIQAAVSAWIAQACDSPDLKSSIWNQMQQHLTEIRPNESQIQSRFTLRLVAILTAGTPRSHSEPVSKPVSKSYAQAQLYDELQQQKQMLEARVSERTQALQDAMLAAHAANQAKSDFLATVSHELRTPLTCIIGMSATLQRWSNSLTDQQRQFLQTIHQSGEHLLTLINDILDLSQVESGRMQLTIQPFSLENLAGQTLKAFEAQANLQGVELKLDLQDWRPQLCEADPRRVRQIMVNLLSNAIKFTPAGGEVTLRLANESNGVMLQVKDTGIGIPDALRPLLFQKFQQLDSSYRREYPGAGLGLALTQHLVELHAGTIDVDSRLGIGSSFTVRLPRPAQSPTPEPLQLKQRRVVLIEPNEASADLICELLLAADCQVVWILEGWVAMRQLEFLQPAIVLLNSQLPDIDGLYLVQSLRQNLSTRSLKIMSLLSDPPVSQTELGSVEAEWRQAGADEVIAHPMQAQIQPEVLVQRVKALMD